MDGRKAGLRRNRVTLGEKSDRKGRIVTRGGIASQGQDEACDDVPFYFFYSRDSRDGSPRL